MTRTLDTATVGAFLSPSHLELADEIEGFVAEAIAGLPAPETDDEARSQARKILTLLGEAGWCRYAVPEKWGGAPGTGERVDSVACCLIRDALAAASPLADSVFALQCLGAMPLVLHASDQIRSAWLPGVATGEVMAGFAMTEPEAGSDVQSMKSRASRTGDGFVLDGEKAFISNAGLADFYATFTRSSGGEGLSCFVVEAENPGCRFVEAQVLSAPHPLGRISFESCAVPGTALLGEEGTGFAIGMETLDRLRATVAAAACGMAARALEEAKHHAGSRVQFGRLLARFQLIQQKLAVMATELAAARLLTYRAARAALDQDSEVTLRSAMAKFQATEAAQRVVDQAVQILGGAGVLASHPLDHLYRSVRALRIYEGTSEIQQLVIARELLRKE